MKLNRCLLTLLLLLALAGCKSTPAPAPPLLPAYTAFHSPHLADIPVRRVIVLPMENYTEYPDAADRVLDTIVNDLRSAGLYDLVQLPPNQARACHDQFALHGSYPEPLLVELAERYRADGVMFSSLNTYHPYWPPRIGLTLNIVSTLEDVTLVAVDGLWDSREACIASQAEAFYGHSSVQHQLPRPELAVYAPNQFERFVGRQVLQAVAAPPVGPQELLLAEHASPAPGAAVVHGAAGTKTIRKPSELARRPLHTTPDTWQRR